MQTGYRRKLAALLSATAMFVLCSAVLKQRVHASPSSGGGIRGTIKIDDIAPHQKVIDMSKEPTCAAEHKNKPIAGEGVVAGAGGGLANVVIYVSQGLNGSETSMVPPEVASLNQKGCQYLPHVVVAYRKRNQFHQREAEWDPDPRW
jgi:hypothetical protein